MNDCTPRFPACPQQLDAGPTRVFRNRKKAVNFARRMARLYRTPYEVWSVQGGKAAEVRFVGRVSAWQAAA